MVSVSKIKPFCVLEFCLRQSERLKSEVSISAIFIHLGLSRWHPSACSAGDAGDVAASLGWEDALEEGMATYSGILAWEMPWTEEPGGLRSMGSQRVGLDWTHTHIHTLTHTVSKAVFVLFWEKWKKKTNDEKILNWQRHNNKITTGFQGVL